MLLDNINTIIPDYLYLSPQYEKIKNLRKLYPNIDYYSDEDRTDILQGDGWTRLGITDIRYPSQVKTVTGLVLSNTCDIAAGNDRLMPAKIVFTPIVKLNEYESCLLSGGNILEKVKNHILAIKNQEVSNRFFLPQAQSLDSEYVALFDDAHSLPLDFYLQQPDKKAYIALSDNGFYLFMIKLAIHFCRLFDGVERQ